MYLEGDVPAVVGAMREKRRLIQMGQANTGPRLLLLGCGGVMYGCEAGGAVTAWTELGYGAVFDWAVAFSTSAPVFGYLLSGNPRTGATIYAEECCTGEFIGWRRYPLSSRYLNEVFQGATGKRMDAAQVLESRTKLFVGITNVRTGKQSFVQPQTADELFRAIWASISMAGLSESLVTIKGRQYFDGASIISGFPIKALVQRLQPTHVVLLANRRKTRKVSPSLPLMIAGETLLRRRIPPVIRTLAWRRRGKLQHSFDWLRQSGIPHVIAWSSGEIGRFERNPDKIRRATAKAEALWCELLS